MISRAEAPSFEDSLAEYTLLAAQTENLVSQNQALRKNIDGKTKQLRQLRSRLQTLRIRRVYQLMKTRNLGVCSAEIKPREFKYGHQNGTSELEVLGLFPEEDLRYYYFSNPDSSEIQGTSMEFQAEDILRLCPRHVPTRLKYNEPYFYPHTRFYIGDVSVEEVTHDEKWNFKIKGTNIDLSRDLYHIGPLPERIYNYFGISTIPEHRFD